LGNVFISYKHDTITEKIYPNPDFDILIGTTVFIDSICAFVMTGDSTEKTIPSEGYKQNYNTDTTCWSYPTSDGCFPSRLIKEV
jgi:hypothetical protein